MAIEPYYEHAGITIYHGDCRDILPHVEADVVVTDPPYGEGYSSGWEGKFRGEVIAGDEDCEARDFVLSAFSPKPCAVFGKWSVPKWGKPKGVLVWNKGPAFGMGDLRFPWKPSWEDIAIYGDGWSGRRDEGVLSGPPVVTWSGRPGSRQHPNEKPVWLLRHLLEKAVDGTVLDPFTGSGSTLCAAKDLGRKAIGIEIEERYCEIAAKRLAQEVFSFEEASRVE